jgi:serine O-acetyltransferase
VIGWLRRLAEDVDVVVERDPATAGRWEALLAPHLPALWLHRVAHRRYLGGHRVLARALTAAGRFLSGGLEIHPGARIGRRLFIDHGTGVVIGETAVVGDDVTMYHQVTLGAVGWWRDRLRAPGERRHPRIGDRVVIGTGATILGPVVVGDDAVIGAHVLITVDVAAGATVLAPRGQVRRARRYRRRGGASREVVELGVDVGADLGVVDR